ncbi:MAG TPA: GDSL-type esterase/lipase family protein [Thermoanaerobaculia bacterium]|jgi:lysophospholipase L1-like esterase|nr:GDSL-type esterase/lipase family protein [Thermoanaerobaculia bacterium]
MTPVRRAQPIILFTLALLGACRREIPNLDSPGTTIVAFGDSITAGYGADGPGTTYPERLAERIGRPVINAGVPGDTTTDALARIEPVLAENPWLVIVELGGNDLLQQVPIERTETNLSAIVERLLAARTVPVLVEIHGPFGGGRFSDLFERLGDKYHVPVLEDALPDILSDRTLKSDEIHPNAAGYAKLAEAVAEELAPILKRRGAR